MSFYTYGVDPEFFLANKNTGKYVSAHTYFKGDKYLPELTDFGAIQVDGTAVEFNTKPAKTKAEFLLRIGQAKTYINKEASKFNLKSVISPTVYFDKEYFEALPRLVKRLGCEADYNVYLGKQNPPPHPTGTFRTGAGHIHIGWGDYIDLEEGYTDKVQGLTRQLDSYLYFKSLEWDSDDDRRKLYGKIGSFRYKPYGVEYRPLSNVWLSSRELQGKVYDIIKKLTGLWDKNVHLYNDQLAKDICERTFFETDTPTKKEVKSYIDYIEEVYI